jgi:plastocyanin
MRQSPVVALVVVAILIVAGCASGGSPTPTGATTAATAPAASPAASAAISAGASGSAAASGAPASDAAAACAPSTDPATVEVAIADFAFGPSTAEAGVGDVVGWTNDDTAPHSAVSDEGGCETEVLQPGEAGALVFDEPGTYAYYCGVHPEMTGTVEVE